MSRHRSTAWLCASSLALWLSACGGGSSSSTTSNTQSATVTTSASQATSQLAIANLIYSDSQRTPDGFYSETVPSFDGYVATSHIKTTDINAGAILKYELCSDDYYQANDWSETANTLSGDNATLASSAETDMYFEFDRLRSGTPNGYLRERIYKCSYISRTTVDLQATSGEAGIFNVRPLSADQLKTLSEYLWQFTTYNNFGNVVLSSTGASDASGLTRTLNIATLTRAESSDACDSIEVFDWQHRVDTSTGDLTLSITPQYSFYAQESNGVISICE